MQFFQAVHTYASHSRHTIYSMGRVMGHVYLQDGEAIYSPHAEGEYCEEANDIIAQADNMSLSFVLELAKFMEELQEADE